MDNERGPMPGPKSVPLRSIEASDKEKEKKLFEDEKINVERQKLAIEALCIQGKLEGLYRQLYQACTQQMVAAQFPKYEAMMDSAKTLFDDLSLILAGYNEITPGEGPRPQQPMN